MQAALAERRQHRRRTIARQRVEQPFVGEPGQRMGVERSGVEGVGDEALVHHGCAAHGVMPVHVPIHLVLREQQRLERGETFFGDAEAGRAGDGVGDDRE